VILRVGRRWAAVALILGALLAACGESGSPAKPPTIPAESLLRQGEGPPCRVVYDVPYHNIFKTCIEIVYDSIAPPEAAPELMGLAFGPDGTLYIARTARGEIWALRDADDDQFMDVPFRAADGLDLPVALAVHGESLYVSSVGGLVRLDDGDGDGVFEDQTVLVAGLSAATGYWPGSVAVGPDGRLYVALGADCVTCEPGTDPRAGRLVSYELDGSGARVEAAGLAYPADFAWHPATGELWIVDRASPAALGAPDELNRWTAGADYGFPACVGDREPDPRFSGDADACQSTEPPRLTFPHQSSPSGIAFYPYDAFPFWEGDLITALNGSSDRPEPAGYALVAVEFAEGQPAGTVDQIAPAGTHGETISVPEYSLLGRGFYPYHPVDVVVSREGWLYVSLQEGRILRLRPRPPD